MFRKFPCILNMYIFTLYTVQVRDGYWYKSPLLARVCGNTLSEPIISTGSRLMLTYRTRENSPDHLGFIAQYEAVCGG